MHRVPTDVELAKVLADHLMRGDNVYDCAANDMQIRYLSAATAVRDTLRYGVAARPEDAEE